MHEISLKDTAADCLSETPKLSVLEDVFGYDEGAPSTLSVKQQLELVRGESLGLNLVLVAPENYPTGAIGTIEFAIQFMRDIYAQVDIGIRTLEWWAIDAVDAGAHAVIDSFNEAEDLVNDWRVDNDFIDVFVVRSANGLDGFSAIDGPCNKRSLMGATGAVVSLNGSDTNVGNTFAHEVGHYLGLEHVSSPTNFIGNNGSSNSNTGITTAQGDEMKGKDCFVEDVC